MARPGLRPHVGAHGIAAAERERPANRRALEVASVGRRAHASPHLGHRYRRNSCRSLSGLPLDTCRLRQRPFHDPLRLAAVEPEIARQWHPTKNGALNPRDVSCGSGKRVWWRCAAVPDHEWETAVCDRTGPRRARCPYCAGRALSVTNLLLAKAPDVAAEWHSVRNGKLKPKDVVAGSTRKAWWRCRADRSHEWEAAILIRTRGSGCPQCAAKRRVAAALAAREVAVRD